MIRPELSCPEEFQGLNVLADAYETKIFAPFAQMIVPIPKNKYNRM